MRPARLLAQQRRLRRQPRTEDHRVQLVTGAVGRGRQLRLPAREPLGGLRQPRAVTFDADVAPHQLTQLVGVRRPRYVCAIVAAGQMERTGGALQRRGRPTRRRRRRLEEPLHRAPGEHHRLQQRVAGEPVRAVHAGARHLADREEAWHGGLAPGVGAHAPHHVVGRGGDGDAVDGHVEPRLLAGAIDLGEARREPGGVFLRDVEQHVVGAGLDHLAVLGERHHVPRRQLRALVVTRHEPLAAGVVEQGPLAAHRLRDQEYRRARQPQRSGVELRELQVHHLRAAGVGKRDAIAGRDVRVRGHAVHLPGTAGGEHDVARLVRGTAAIPAVEHLDTDGAPVVHQHALGQRVLGDRCVLPAGERGEREFDLHPGRVATGVDDARRGVRRLAAQRHLPVRGIEAHAVADQVGDAAGGIHRENPRGLLVHEPRARLDGVSQVRLRRVARADRGGDAALRVAGARLVDRALRHHQHARVALPRLQRGVEPGDAGADHHEVEAAVRHRRRPPPSRSRPPARSPGSPPRSAASPRASRRGRWSCARTRSGGSCAPPSGRTRPRRSRTRR